MTETRDETTDIAWMRNLAEEGARAPMRGASILMAAGVIYGSASLVHWAIISQVLTVPLAALNLLWLVATGLFLIVVVTVSLRSRADAGVRTTAGRGAGAAWSAVGWGIFALCTSLAVMASRGGEEGVGLLLGVLPSVIMTFYGLGWSVTATMQKSRMLWVLAVAAFVSAPVLAVMVGTTGQYLAYAGCLFALMALPGLLLMRAAKA
jgi:hypothetical protein